MSDQARIDINAIEKQFGPIERAEPVVDPQPEKVQEIPPPDPQPKRTGTWKDVVTVKKLSDYLKKHQTFRLMQDKNGKLILHFINGIPHSDKEGLKRASKAVDLLIDALDDLRILVAKDRIQLPVYKGRPNTM